MGLLSATISGVWSAELIHEGACWRPINITLAVLGAGLLFHYLRRRIDAGMRAALKRLPLRGVISVGIIVLGILSSVISAIIAALILVEFITVLRLHRRAEIHLTIPACFAIGLGAALTPLGEPLSTIVVSKLSGEPHRATFFYLADLLGVFTIAMVVVCGIVEYIFLVRESKDDTEVTLSMESSEESVGEVFLRSLKVYSRRRLQTLDRRVFHQNTRPRPVLGKYGLGHSRQRYADCSRNRSDAHRVPNQERAFRSAYFRRHAHTGQYPQHHSRPCFRNHKHGSGRDWDCAHWALFLWLFTALLLMLELV